MAVSRVQLAFVASLCIVVVYGGALHAQILNAPSQAGGGVQQASGNVGAAPESGSILPASWLGLQMPRVSMPKVTMPKITMPKWPTGQDGKAISPFAPLTAGFSKVSLGAKKAWEGTMEMFTFGSGNNVSQPRPRATSQPKPSFWQRMFSSAPEPDGPQTVSEWMSQQRLDP